MKTENEAEELTLLNFKICYKATLFKTVVLYKTAATELNGLELRVQKGTPRFTVN